MLVPTPGRLVPLYTENSGSVPVKSAPPMHQFCLFFFKILGKYMVAPRWSVPPYG